MARLEAGQIQLEIEPVDLAHLARRLTEQVQVTAPAYTFELETPAELMVMADRSRLEQAVTNLLTNAVKYSPAAQDIQVTVHAADGEGQITIRDHGIGIPKQDQARIFGRFARATNVLHQGIKGTGLGLHLTKELIDRQGGRIWFTSEVGVGTTFHIALLLAEAP